METSHPHRERKLSSAYVSTSASLASSPPPGAAAGEGPDLLPPSQTGSTTLHIRSPVWESPRNPTRSPVTAKPLSSHPLNTVTAAPVLVKSPRSHTIAVLAPVFPWDKDEADTQLSTEPVGQQRRSSSSLVASPRCTGGGSGASAPGPRRSPVLGPALQDCVDIQDDDGESGNAEEGDGEARVGLSCHSNGSGPENLSKQPQQRPPRSSPPMVEDLQALVNAGSVGRCRSDSNGMVDLIGSTVRAVRHPQQSSPSPEGVERVVSAHSDSEARHGEAAFDHHGEDREKDDTVTTSNAADFADCEFLHTYLYHPALPAEAEAKQQQTAIEDEDRRFSVWRDVTPVRMGLTRSASASMPRWARCLAEETPFTPFPRGGAARATAMGMTPTPDRTRWGMGTLGGTVEPPPPLLSSRVTVHDVMETILSAPAAAAEITPLADGAENGSTGRPSLSPDEPPPRLPSPDAEMEAEQQLQLYKRVQDAHERLEYIDQLKTRLDRVLSSRQEELHRLAKKQTQLSQQCASFKSRSLAVMKDVRRIRERQHGEDELLFLQDMTMDRANRLEVAQGHLKSLQRLWERLMAPHIADTNEGDEEREEKAAVSGERLKGEEAVEPPNLPSPRSPSAAASSESSVASLGTCDALDDFLCDLKEEVEALVRICIQLPSPPPAGGLSNRFHQGQSLDPSGRQKSTLCTWRAPPSRSTRSALNRRLNDGNNGFFSFFGGATAEHLDSKPLSTFLANLNRLARMSWEREEELQLLARELSTEWEEEDLKARLVQNDPHGGSSMWEPTSEQVATPIPAPAARAEGSQRALDDGETGVSLGTSPLNILTPRHSSIGAAATHRATRQLFFSSPEHGRRSTGGPTSPGVPLSPPSQRRLLHSPLSGALSLLPLPSLLYAFPRLAAVSRSLDEEQQRLQGDYAAAIGAERQHRRALTAQLRETYQQQVAPALHGVVDALRSRQTSLAVELSRLGVKRATIEWEEEDDLISADVTTLEHILDGATAATQRPLREVWRCGAGGCASLRRGESELLAGDVSSRCASLAQWENGEQQRAVGLDGVSSAALATPPPRVYRRTLTITCATAINSVEEGGLMEDGAESEFSSPTVRLARQSGVHEERGGVRQHRGNAPHRSGNGRGSGGGANDRPTSPRFLSAPVESSAEYDRGTVTLTACAALQLSTCSPAKTLSVRRPATTTEMDNSAVSRQPGPAAPAMSVTPITTPSFRHSGGTPRPSGPGRTSSILTPRNSTATGSSRGSEGECDTVGLPSPRQRECGSTVSAAPLLQHPSLPHHPHAHLDTRRLRRGSARTSSPPPPSPFLPTVEDTRALVRLTEKAEEVQKRPSCTTMSTPAAAVGPWHPFECTNNSLAGGAVQVALTFTGQEAHRRRVAEEQQKAYQREFWKLREELARIDEDSYHLGTRLSRLQEMRKQRQLEHHTKLVDAEKKLEKSRKFHDALKRERDEWRELYDALH